MEAFFDTLKTKLLYYKYYKTRAEAKMIIFKYVETFYNKVRLHSKLGYKSSENYEKERVSA